MRQTLIVWENNKSAKLHTAAAEKVLENDFKNRVGTLIVRSCVSQLFCYQFRNVCVCFSRKHSCVHQPGRLLLSVLSAPSPTCVWEARGGGGGEPESGQWLTKHRDKALLSNHWIMVLLWKMAALPSLAAPHSRFDFMWHIYIPLTETASPVEGGGFIQSRVQTTCTITCFVTGADIYLPSEHLHSPAADSPRAGANPHISVYSDDGHQPALQSRL